MRTLNNGFKGFVCGGFFVVCWISSVGNSFSQPDDKFSIENKVVQERLRSSMSYSALAPESIFSNMGAGETLYEQMKVLTRTIVEQQERSQKAVFLSAEPLPVSGSAKSLDVTQPFIERKDAEEVETKREASQKRGIPLETRNIVRNVFSQSSATAKSSPLELIEHDDVQGTLNTLSYERIEGRGVRFRYTEIPEEIVGHFWRLKRSYDLRGKTIRIYYSGILPNEISFLFFRSYWSVKAIYNIRLEDSEETQTITFQIPNRWPFKDVSIVELRIEKAKAGKPYADFLIEKVEVLESDDHSTSIKTDNEPKPFSFGGPYLQSNIWGGEVRAS